MAATRDHPLPSSAATRRRLPVVPREDRGSARIRSWTFGLLTALPPLLTLGLIYRYGVDVPYRDDWRVVALLLDMYDGSLTIDQIFKLENSHFTAIPYLLSLVLGNLTAYNVLVPMYASWAMMLLIATILWSLLDKPIRSAGGSAMLFVPIMWILFCPRQAETLLIEAGMAAYAANLFAILALFSLVRADQPNVWLALALNLGALSSLSFGSGIFVWPAGVALMALLRVRRGENRKPISWWPMASWVSVAVGVTAVYWWAWRTGGVGATVHGPQLHLIREDPLKAFGFLLAVLGGGFQTELIAAQWVGLLYVSAVVWLGCIILRHDPAVSKFAVPAALVTYAVGGAAAIAISRIGMGAEQALHSRYATQTLLGFAGLYLIAVLCRAPRSSTLAYVRSGIMLLLFIGVATSYLWAEGYAATSAADRRLAHYYLSNADAQSDRELSLLHPDPKQIRAQTPRLRERRLSVFRDSPPASVPPP